MQSWIKQLFGSTDKALDILNVGRVIFYTASGLLAVYPVLMTGRLILDGEASPPPTFYGSIETHSNALNQSASFLFLTSLIAGFVVAKVGFTTILQPVTVLENARLGDWTPRPNNFNYRYPWLKDKGEHDYQAWLVAEYFRYLEIASFLPLGLYVGLVASCGYAVVYLLSFGIALPTPVVASPAVTALTSLVLVVLYLRHQVWNQFWVPRVLAPTARTWIKAKIALIAGVAEFRQKHGSPAEGETQDDG